MKHMVLFFLLTGIVASGISIHLYLHKIQPINDNGGVVLVMGFSVAAHIIVSCITACAMTETKNRTQQSQ